MGKNGKDFGHKLHRKSNDFEMLFREVPTSSQDIPINDLILHTHNFYSDDEDEFIKPEESIYKEVFQYYDRKFRRFFQRYVQLYRIKIYFSLGVFFAVYILAQFGYNNNEFQVSYAEGFSKDRSTPLDKLIMPNLNSLYPGEDITDSFNLFDFRLSAGLLLLYIQNYIVHNNYKLETDFSIPFSWSDWVDLDSRLAIDSDYLVDWLSVHSKDFLNELDTIKKLDCKHFATLFGVESSADFKRQCEDIGETISADYFFKFVPSGPTTAKIKEPGRVLYGAAYLKLKMPPPRQIYLMNVFGSDGEGSLMVNVNDTSETKAIFRTPLVLQAFIDWYCSFNKIDIKLFLKDGWSIRSLRRGISKIIQETHIGKIIYRKEHKYIDSEQTYVAIKDPKKDAKMRMSEWTFDDFQWDENKFLDALSMKRSVYESEINFDTKLYDSVNEAEQNRINTGKHPKYLHEAHLYGSTIGSHYDWRFFTTSLISNDFRQSVIHRLARTWLKFCFENEIKTFIAYGSMLGWIRNGLSLPWDGDIDVIVTMESFNLLARNFNQTLIMDYSSSDRFQSAMTGYLIDINPAYYSRVRDDGSNVIDGRLIDISTGMYLDITALAWTENYLKEVKLSDKIRKVIDKDYEMNKDFAVEGEIYNVALMDQLRQLQNNKQLVHCKNDNVYKIEELVKMVPSYFEGIRAYFPHMYEDIIWRLYPKALTRITEPNHIYDEVYRLWVNDFDCPSYVDWMGNALESAEFGTCDSLNVLQEYRMTEKYTARHQEIMKENDFLNLELSKDSEIAPFRIDEFFIIYSSLLGFTNEQLEEFYAPSKE